MTKVVLKEAETPSEAIIKAAKKVVVVTDGLGRQLKVRKLGALHRMDLARLVGPDGVQNPVVFGHAALAFSVIEIDGEAIMPPNSYAELRALVGRLDDEGLECAGQAAVDHFGVSPDGQTLQEAAELLKNG